MVGPVGGGSTPSEKPSGEPSGSARPFSLYRSLTQSQLNELFSDADSLAVVVFNNPHEKMPSRIVPYLQKAIKDVESDLNQKPPLSPEMATKLKNILSLLKEAYQNKDNENSASWDTPLSNATGLISELG